VIVTEEQIRIRTMLFECPECGYRIYTLETSPSGKKYLCGKCGARFIFLQTEVASKRGNRRVLGWNKTAKRAVLIAAISLILIFVGGTSFASVKPEHPLATPFKSEAITVLETSSEAIDLIDDISRVVATYERNIVSTMLQSMRVIEGSREVPPLIVPTNDMARFPSAEYPLFPEYVEKRFSQFKYTVDNNGIVSVDASGATTDAFLEKIER